MNTSDFKDKIKRLAPSRPDKASPTVRVKGDRGFDPPRAAHSPLPWRVQDEADRVSIVTKTQQVATMWKFPTCGERRANACYIVAACNNVERLADALLKLKTLGEAVVPDCNIDAHLTTMYMIAADALRDFELDRLQTPH